MSQPGEGKQSLEGSLLQAEADMRKGLEEEKSWASFANTRKAKYRGGGKVRRSGWLGREGPGA